MLPKEALRTQLVPVRVQGELVQAEKLMVQAMMILVKKFGKDNLVRVSQQEAALILKDNERVEINYNFEHDSLDIRVR